MNKYFVVVAFLCGIAPLYASVGCMAHSKRLAEKYDNKEYHYVACNCPCRDKYDRKDTCKQCGHAHDPHTLIIVGEDDVGSRVATPHVSLQQVALCNRLDMTPQDAVEGMIKRSKKR